MIVLAFDLYFEFLKYVLERCLQLNAGRWDVEKSTDLQDDQICDR